MVKSIFLAVISLFSFIGFSQDANILVPADLRQHNLTQFNASLYNPAFSLNLNNPQSISLWTRWQWQNIDVDPSTLFLNYTRALNDNSAAGVGFFEHNTGVFFDTGVALNYAYKLQFDNLLSLSFGLNLFAFKQELADTRFPSNPIPGIPGPELTSDFILQVAPGINLEYKNFSVSLASENLVSYNFTESTSNAGTSNKIFMGLASYEFSVLNFDETAYIRPSVYVKTIPNQKNQLGLNTLFSTQKYWGQVGYNNFYGISAGAGGTIFNRFSLGALVEFGISSSLSSNDPSFELIASYFIGKPSKRRRIVSNEFEKRVKKQKERTSDEVRDDQREAKKTTKLNASDKKKQKIEASKQKELERKLRQDKSIADKASKEEAALLKKRDKEKAKITKDRNKDKKALAAKKKNVENQQRLAKLKIENDAKKEAAIAARKALEIRTKDSINKLREEAKLLAEQKAANEAKIAKEKAAARAEDVTPLPGEKYQEVSNSEGLESGFYLIANVFGTKKYFNVFMADLAKLGIKGKSFYRSSNRYNYVYLARYNTIGEARKARDSNFDGKFKGKTWIFRVVDN